MARAPRAKSEKRSREACSSFRGIFGEIVGGCGDRFFPLLKRRINRREAGSLGLDHATFTARCRALIQWASVGFPMWPSAVSQRNICVNCQSSSPRVAGESILVRRAMLETAPGFSRKNGVSVTFGFSSLPYSSSTPRSLPPTYCTASITVCSSSAKVRLSLESTYIRERRLPRDAPDGALASNTVDSVFIAPRSRSTPTSAAIGKVMVSWFGGFTIRVCCPEGAPMSVKYPLESVIADRIVP